MALVFAVADTAAVCAWAVCAWAVFAARAVAGAATDAGLSAVPSRAALAVAT